MDEHGRERFEAEPESAPCRRRGGLFLVRVLALLGILALGALLVGGLSLWLGSRPRFLTLQNGITLRCLGVSYGTNHVAYIGSPANQALHRLLGFVFPRFRQNTPAVRRQVTPAPSLVIFLREAVGAAANPVPSLSLTSMLADDRGVMAGDRQWISPAGGSPGAPLLWSPSFEVVPRRSRTLSLQFSATGPDGKPMPLGAIEVPNPVFTNPPPLIAEPFPIVHTNGELEGRLEALAFGTGSSSGSARNADGSDTISESPASPGEEVRATALFEFRENGTNTTAWVMGSLTVSDATGNRAKAGSYSSQIFDGFHVLTFAPVPWPGEPWRLDGWAKRTAAGRFSADELVVLRDVALPPSGRTNQLEHAASPGGIPIVVKGFVRRAPVAGGSYSSDVLSRLLLELAELPEDAFVDLVRVEDDQGRVLTSDMTSMAHGTPVKLEFGFRAVPEDARTLNLTLAVHRGRAFTFVAQPHPVGTNGFQYTFRASSSR